jgi:cytidylate kinase
MAVNTPDNPLLVFEYGGTARGGKGTIVGDLDERYDFVAAEETGADYRVVAKVLLEAGKIDPEMPKEAVAAALGGYAIEELADIVAARPHVVEEYGFASLYKPDVNNTVSSVSPVIPVRKAVKAGFARRVEAVADDENKDVLLVDGRNLDTVVCDISRARLVLRTFVTCTSAEAALREVTRNKQLGDKDAFEQAEAAIIRRNHNDSSRTVDPVIPEADAIDYWRDSRVSNVTAQHIAETLFEGNLARVIGRPFEGLREYMDLARRGAGSLAVVSGRQIVFDTTPYRDLTPEPRERMLEASGRMFDEALATYRMVHGGARGAFAAGH